MYAPKRDPDTTRRIQAPYLRLLQEGGIVQGTALARQCAGDGVGGAVEVGGGLDALGGAAQEEGGEKDSQEHRVGTAVRQIQSYHSLRGTMTTNASAGPAHQDSIGWNGQGCNLVSLLHVLENPMRGRTK